MAELTGGFDATKVDPLAERKVLPEGKYQAVIVESAKERTKDGTSEYLRLRYQVIAGEHRGSTIEDRLMIWHPSEDAVRYARARLSAICRAVNVLQLRDSVQLHNIPLVLSVGVKPWTNGQGQSKLGNEVRGYEPRIAASAASTQSASGEQSATASQSANKPDPFAKAEGQPW